jgi:oligopeptide/dipeptide ABC transporter ATP-binding protein
MDDPLLRVEHLRTQIATAGMVLPVVDDVSFDLRAGETLAVIGESGSGKTSLALSLMRLMSEPGRIIGGQVWFEGRDLVALPEGRMRAVRGRGIGMIFQNPRDRFDPLQTIGSQLCEVLKLYGKARSRSEAWRQAVGLLAETRIAAPEVMMHLYPNQPSGGMLQRAMVAMALAGSPKLLIADEPTSALDVTIQAELLTLLRLLQQERHMAILFITHDVHVARDVADDVAVMYAGQIVELGPAQDVLAAPAHPYTRSLLACVPAGDGQSLVPIAGHPPNLGRLPAGCRFALRCVDALRDARKDIMPELGPIAGGRLVRCWLTGQDAA